MSTNMLAYFSARHFYVDIRSWYNMSTKILADFVVGHLMLIWNVGSIWRRQRCSLTSLIDIWHWHMILIVGVTKDPCCLCFGTCDVDKDFCFSLQHLMLREDADLCCLERCSLALLCDMCSWYYSLIFGVDSDASYFSGKFDVGIRCCYLMSTKILPYFVRRHLMLTCDTRHAIIYVMPIHRVCIHHTGMPNILAQYIRDLELSFHHWKTSAPTAATLLTPLISTWSRSG